MGMWRKVSTVSAIMRSNMTLTGEVVFIYGDAKSRALDAAAGFVMGLSVGLVTRIVDVNTIQVCYLWPETGTWKGSWIRWQMKKTKK